MCEELELANSKMASVEEIRTRVSLQEHDVINVSLVFVSWYIVFLIHYFSSYQMFCSFRRIAQTFLVITQAMMTRGVRKNSKR